MSKIYFVSYTNMDDVHLRANSLYHGHLIFFIADTNEAGQLQFPPKVQASYGFYSHKLTKHHTFFTSPISTMANIFFGNETSLRGSYGEWREENIHDLTYGPGLMGRLVAYSEEHYYKILKSIHDQIALYNLFFMFCSTDEEKEDFYQAVKRSHSILAEIEHPEYNNFDSIVESRMPIPQFKLSLRGSGNSCKIAALNEMEKVFGTDHNPIKHYIDQLRGTFTSHSIPRMTPLLTPIIIHAETNKWQTRGRNSKYPFVEWDTFKQDPNSTMYAVDIGEYYVDTQGRYQSVKHVTSCQRQTIYDIKLLSRQCEIKLGNPFYDNILKQCHRYLRNYAEANQSQLAIRDSYARRYLKNLLNDKDIQNKIYSDAPRNLRQSMYELVMRYKTPRDEKSLSIQSIYCN